MKRWAAVIRLGGIGDNLMVSSVFPGLKQKFDGLEVICKAPNHVVYENNPYIDKLVVWPEDDEQVDGLTWQRNIAKRAAEFDAFFHLSHTCEFELALMEGQTAFWWPEKARRQKCDRAYLALLHDICDVPHHYAPNFFPTEIETARAWDTRNKIMTLKPGPVIGWCLSGSRVDKWYPYSGPTVARLILELGANVILFGAPTQKDKTLAKQIQEQIKQQNGDDKGLHSAFSHDPEADKVIKGFAGRPGTQAPQPGQWPIRRILAQTQVCDLFIGPDTGPAWAVAMKPMPKIILLSHASAKNIITGWTNTAALHASAKTDCWPCHRLHEDFKTCRKADGFEASACMADISPSAIVRAAKEALQDCLGAKPPRPPGLPSSIAAQLQS